jgi:hypothetical protein
MLYKKEKCVKIEYGKLGTDAGLKRNKTKKPFILKGCAKAVVIDKPNKPC